MSWGGDGARGWGLTNRGLARTSGATLIDIFDAGYLEQPSVPDPVLKVTRLSGGKLRATIRGAVGSSVRLHVGARPSLASSSPLEKPAMNDSTWTEWVGVIGASGKIVFEFSGSYPIAFGQRDLLALQASTFAGGKLFTNSVFR